jgi:hypothetical protein
VGLGDAWGASALGKAVGPAVATGGAGEAGEAGEADGAAPGAGPRTVLARKTAVKKVTAALLLS